MMLHPAADSEQNPNNSKTRVGTRGGASAAVPTVHQRWRLPHLCCPLVAAAPSHSPTSWKGARSSFAPQSPGPNSVSQFQSRMGPGWDQEGTKRASPNPSSATYQQRGFFIHSCTPSSHDWELQ